MWAVRTRAHAHSHRVTGGTRARDARGVVTVHTPEAIHTPESIHTAHAVGPEHTPGGGWVHSAVAEL